MNFRYVHSIDIYHSIKTNPVVHSKRIFWPLPIIILFLSEDNIAGNERIAPGFPLMPTTVPGYNEIIIKISNHPVA